MLITYDYRDFQELVVCPAKDSDDSDFVRDVPEKLVQDYLSALEAFRNASAALERAIG